MPPFFIYTKHNKEMNTTKQYLMMMAASVALLCWSGSGSVAKAQLLSHVDPGNVAHVYGAGESTKLTGSAGPVGIYANGEPNAVTGGANIVIHSYNAGGSWTDYTRVWNTTWSQGSNCPHGEI